MHPFKASILFSMKATRNPTPAFRLEERNPEAFRAATRKASIRIIVVFALSAMLLSTLLVSFFGDSAGDNFKWNLTGVILGLLLTAALVGGLFRKQQWMDASVYGWRLKRSLMSITNQMHQLKAAVARHDPQAMLLLRFYHLALHQMHQLDGNSSGASDLVQEMNLHADAMTAMQLELEQPELNPDWLAHLKSLPGQKNT